MNKTENILTILQALQKKEGCVTEEGLLLVSKERGIPPNEVFSVASFYSFLSNRPRGKYVIRLCKSLPCSMKGSAEILHALREKLQIGPGETSKDKRFSLELINCIGACDMAPAMLIGNKLYGNLTRKKIDEIIDECT